MKRRVTNAESFPAAALKTTPFLFSYCRAAFLRVSGGQNNSTKKKKKTFFFSLGVVVFCSFIAVHTHTHTCLTLQTEKTMMKNKKIKKWKRPYMVEVQPDSESQRREEEGTDIPPLLSSTAVSGLLIRDTSASTHFFFLDENSLFPTFPPHSSILPFFFFFCLACQNIRSQDPLLSICHLFFL